MITTGNAKRVFCDRRCKGRWHETTPRRRSRVAAYNRGPGGRATRLRYKYGIEPNDLLRIMVAQGCDCAICRTPDPDHRYGWAVDHDHTTGRVRGVLCQRCNLGIGNFRESVETLRAAIHYLDGVP